MTTERLWLGVILVVIGAYLLLRVVGMGLPLMGYWFGVIPSIHHLAAGTSHFAHGFQYHLIRSVIQTIIPLMLVGMGVYLVLRTR